MSSINEMIAKVERLNIEQLCEESFNLNSEIAEDLNREQLQRGEGVKSEMPNYSRTSIEFFGKPNSGIELFETGDFYKGITFEAVGATIHAYSTDEKNDMLEKEYSLEQPLGLNRASIIELNKVLQPTLIEEVSKELGT